MRCRSESSSSMTAQPRGGGRRRRRRRGGNRNGWRQTWAAARAQGTRCAEAPQARRLLTNVQLVVLEVHHQVAQRDDVRVLAEPPHQPRLAQRVHACASKEAAAARAHAQRRSDAREQRQWRDSRRARAERGARARRPQRAGAPSVRLSAIGAIFLIATLLFVSLFSAEMTTPYAPAQKRHAREWPQMRAPAPALTTTARRALARGTHRAPAP